MKHILLTQQLGQNSTTSRDPVAAVISQDGDTITAQFSREVRTINLREQATCCLSCDNDLLVQVDKWGTVEVDIPDWMTPQDYLRNLTPWRYYIGFGAQPAWPRQWFQRLSGFHQNARFAAIKLLNTKKFRSPFRQSLRSQLEAWLNDPKPKYDSPFSDRQWQALFDHHTCLDAKLTAESIYRTR